MKRNKYEEGNISCHRRGKLQNCGKKRGDRKRTGNTKEKRKKSEGKQLEAYS